MVKTRILVSLHVKGGVGKTLVAGSVAAELARRGNRVLIVDCDEQASATAWAGAAPDNALFPATVVNLALYKDKIHREIQRHVEHYDFIVVDTPPQLGNISSSALLVADLAIVPLPPSPLELWAAQAVKALILQAMAVNTDLQAVLLANKTNRTALCSAAMHEMEDFGIPMMQSKLSSRVAYQQAVLAGVPVTALGSNASAAAMEVRAAVDEILEILGDAK